MKSLRTLLLSLFVVTIAIGAQGQPVPAAKVAKIKTLLEVSGSTKQAKTAANAMIGSLEQIYTDVKPGFWAEFAKEVNPEDLERMLIPIFHKHYTTADIDGLIAFYRTPVGKKLVEKSALVAQESSEVNMRWSRSVSEKVVEKLKSSSGN